MKDGAGAHGTRWWDRAAPMAEHIHVFQQRDGEEEHKVFLAFNILRPVAIALK